MQHLNQVSHVITHLLTHILTHSRTGPGHYDLTGKFISGKDPRHIVFPKGAIPKDKSGMGPGPGSYKPLESMGKQVLSTKHAATVRTHTYLLTHSLTY